MNTGRLASIIWRSLHDFPAFASGKDGVQVNEICGTDVASRIALRHCMREAAPDLFDEGRGSAAVLYAHAECKIYSVGIARRVAQIKPIIDADEHIGTFNRLDGPDILLSPPRALLGRDPGQPGRTDGLLKRPVLVLGALGEAFGFQPEEDRRAAQDQGEQRDPFVGLQPESLSLGGLAICFGLNLLGGWLYLYDDRRPRLTGRRLVGLTVIVGGWLAGAGGYLWAALSGGGY